MRKFIIFIDIDGTLVNLKEEIPSSAIKAIREARSNGHLVYLCTGRSKPEIYDFILDIGIDGIIGAGGGFIEINNNLLYHKKVSKKNVEHLVNYFNENNFDFYLESNGGLFASKNLVARLNKLFYGDYENDPKIKQEMLEHPNKFIAALITDVDNLYLDDVNKACFIENTAVPFAEIIHEFADEFEVIKCTVPSFGENSGELMVPGIHKAIAIEDLLKHLNISQESSIAIGDGLNDTEMLEYCQIGIAMDNAQEGLKAIADYITDDVDHDGLYNAFKHFGII